MKRNRRAIITSIAAMMALAIMVGAGFQSSRDLFQKALQMEEGQGDLQKAIGLYQDIVKRFPENREVAAKAQLHIGLCYEKLGNAEARKAYEGVVREYADQKETAATAQARLAALAGAGGATGSSTLSVRRVWANADVTGKVSADGRFLSFTDWKSENVAIRDLATGQTRLLTDKGDLGGRGWAEPSMPSPDGKNVAFTWNSGGSSLCVVGLDGSKPRVLRAAGNGVIHLLPIAWSPDGRHLLAEFVKTDGTRDMMLVAVADGSAKLLKAMGKDLSPGGEFSPDGRTIAWAAKDGLSLFDLQTGTESSLIPDRSNPSVLGWAPDGRHILFSSERTGSADAWLVAVAGGKAQGKPVFVRKNWGNLPMGFTRTGAFYYAVINNIWDVQIGELDPAGGNKVSPPQSAFRRGNTRAPDWSPDGRSLAAVDAREPSRAVIVRSMDTGEERELAVGERTIEMGGLHWTPDGKAVVVPASEPEKGESLIRIDVQTGQVTSLMPLPALSGWPRFEFSRDGNIVFYVRPPDPFAAHAARLVSHDLRSGHETEIVQKPGLIWGAISPDGQRVLINTISDKSWSLLVMPASGGEPRELVRVDREKETPFGGSPSWTSDGRFIVFLKGAKGSAPGQWPGQWQLWRVPVEGGEPQRIGLIAARQLQGVRLHPDGRRVAIGDVKVDLEVWVMENFLPVPKAAK
jgi:Tol biopolymer transport system component